MAKKANTPIKEKVWACDFTVMGYGFVVKGSPVTQKQLDAHKEHFPKEDLSKYVK